MVRLDSFYSYSYLLTSRRKNPYSEDDFNPLRTTLFSRTGGDKFQPPPPSNSLENWQVEYSTCTYATIKICRKKISFEGARPEKGLKN